VNGLRYVTRTLGTVAVPLAFGAALVYIGWSASQTQLRQLEDAQVIDAPGDYQVEAVGDHLDDVLSAAVDHLAQHGTFRGFTHAGVDVVAGSQRAGFTATLAGECWFAAVIDGVAHTPQLDPSGLSCTPEARAFNQMQLDFNEDASGHHLSVAYGFVQKAAASAVLWQSMRGTFDDFPAESAGPNVTVARNGDRMHLSSRVDGVCAALEVTTQGDVRDAAC
jgi:hypothetical protein